MHKYLLRAASRSIFSKILMVISLGSTFSLCLSVLVNFSMYYLYIRKCKEAAFYLEKINYWRTLYYLVEGRGINDNVFNSLPILFLNELEGLISFLKLIKKIVLLI